METEQIIYLVTEYASRGEIFGKLTSLAFFLYMLYENYHEVS